MKPHNSEKLKDKITTEILRFVQNDILSPLPLPLGED